MTDVFELADFAVDAHDSLAARIVEGSSSMPAMRVPGRSDAFFAIDSVRDFYLLIRVSRSVNIGERRLDALRISAGDRFTIAEAGDQDSSNEPYASVVLAHSHPQLLTAFGTLSGVLLAALPGNPSSGDLEGFLTDFLELFAPRTSTGRELVLGPWGELWLMSQSEQVADFARSWRTNNSDRYDFSFDNLRLEVKTTELERRVHSFALTQLEDQNKPTWIASVAAISDPSGSCIADLMAQILAIVPLQDRARFSRTCLQVLGGDLEAVTDFRFSPSGVRPLMLLPADRVPRVTIPDGALVSGVRFVADISAEAEADETALGDLHF